MDHRIYYLLIIVLILYSILLSITYNSIWIIVLLSSGIIYGVIGVLVSLRKLYFLASASPHIALLAIALAIPTARLLYGSEQLYGIIYGLIMIYIAGYMIHRGISSDQATAFLVGAVSSLTVITIYYILVHYPLEFNISSLIIGDPLLTSWSDASVSLLIALTTLAILLLTYHEQLSLGVDRESTMLMGINVKLYDLITYTVIGLGAIALLPIVGYILEHVLVLLPPTIALLRANNAREAVLLTILSSTTASLLGLHLGLLLDLAPTGLIGLILLVFYIIVFIGGKK